MPKAKPVSLFPLTFEEAITAIIRVDPQRPKRDKKKSPKRKKKK